MATTKDLVRLLASPGGRGLFAQAQADTFGVREGASGEGPSPEEVRKAEALARSLEEMGPTYVKLGQLLSTRYDILPEAYTRALGRLQDQVKPIPQAQVRALVERELGAPLEEVFSSFTLDPVAAASLGQVHRAVTREGEAVAVKVQRPEAREAAAQDMETLQRVALLMDAATPLGAKVGTGALLAQFRRALADELDYEKEAANLEAFARMAEGVEALMVPRPLPAYSTSRVLTMEWIEGRHVMDPEVAPLLQEVGPQVADALFSFYLSSIFEERVLHADPHPGNMLITEDGRLALLDLGMITTVPVRMRDRLLKLFIALGDGDGGRCADILAELGTPSSSFDGRGFRDAVAHLISSTTILGARIKTGKVFVALARLCTAYGLRPPAEMSLLGKALLNLDQVALHLDPTFAPLEKAEAHLTRVFLRSMGVSKASVARSTLEARELAAEMPSRLNRITEALADGNLSLRVDAIDEASLYRVITTIANRLVIAVVLASTVLAAALLARISTEGYAIFGVPLLAAVFFLLSALGGFTLVGTILWSDRRTSKRLRERSARERRS